MSGFSSKVVLITGASSGIGAATAKAFAKHGACLSITGRNKANLNAVAEECKTLGAKKVLEIVAHLENKDDLGRIVNETIYELQQLDVLVNNAGIVFSSMVDNFTVTEFDETINVNLKAPMLLTQLAIPHLEKTKGNIVNTSTAGAQCYGLPTVYTTSKAGLDHFTKTSALELAKKGIRVNAVSPAAVQTNLVRNIGLTAEQIDALWKETGKHHPLGQRNIEPEEIADAILFLASDSAKMITGTILAVDGGCILSKM